MRVNHRKWAAHVKVTILSSYPQLTPIVFNIIESSAAPLAQTRCCATWGTMSPVQPPESPGIQLFHSCH